MSESLGDSDGEKISNFTILFGCDPSCGVEAKTSFIQDFIEHITLKFDSSVGKVDFPEVLNQIDKKEARFESVTNLQGKPLEMTRQDNKVGFKVMIVILDDEKPGTNLQTAIDHFKQEVGVEERDILKLTKKEALMLSQIYKPSGTSLTHKESLSEKIKEFTKANYMDGLNCHEN